MRENPKIVSLDPVMSAAAGVTPNAPVRHEMIEAMADTPGLLRSLGFEHPYDLDEQELGRGGFARAFLSPSGKVLKLTVDPTDAMVSSAIADQGPIPGLVNVEAVYRMPAKVRERPSDPEPRSNLYAIVVERVRPLHRIWPPDEGLPPSVTPEQSEDLKVATDALATAVGPMTGMSRHRPLRSMHETLAKAMEEADRVGIGPDGMQYLHDLVQGWMWMADHGYRMGDLHTGNVGLAMDGRAVLLDLGMSAESATSAQQAEEVLGVAANPSPDVDAVFDECFDRVEELFPDFGTCEFYEDVKAGKDNGAGADRQFAYCQDGNPIAIAFAPKAASLPRAQLVGLMRHEFGHALEYRYGVKDLERRLGRKLPEKVERRADAIAEAVWGEPIVYDERYVQCVGVHGVHPRPAHLPDEKAKLKANPTPLGECYPFAFKMAVKYHGDPGTRIVHGRVTDKFSGESYLHAWVEREGRVFDWQTSFTRPDGIEQGVFYEIFRPSDMTSYSTEEVVRHCVAAGHHGPWEPREKAKLKANPPPAREFTAYHASVAGMPQKPTEFRSYRGMDYGPGFYLGTDPADLWHYGDRVYEATVRLTNPIVISHDQPPDGEVLGWLKRALRLGDEDLEDYVHPLVGVFALAGVLAETGEIDPRRLVAALQKRGYDGVYVDGDVVNEHQSMDLRGDYLTIFSPEQLLTWEEQSAERLRGHHGSRED